MHKSIITTLLSSAVICACLSISTFQANSATARVSITKLTSQGFRHCKSFDREGKSAWTGVVRGNTLDSNARVNGSGFSIRDCFSTKSECQQFINNINRVVANVDYLQYKKCSPR